MCETCGCGGSGEAGHGREHEREQGKVPTPILQANDKVAERIRRRLARSGILALDIVGSPGAGKTAILEATLDRLPHPAGVIVGDLATDNDARRLRRDRVPVVSLETGTTCHITAPMIERALERLPLDELAILFIENVGNLICPALFDLGEAAKVVIGSVAEGTDKPEKYPVMFQHADLFIVNKLDLLPYTDFDYVRCAELARRVKPGLEVLLASARTGDGLTAWLDWIERRRAATTIEAA